MYQSKADYTRAKRVYEIGLEHHPDSVDGQFILSQAEMALGNLTTAEKWLKKVLDKVPSHQGWKLHASCSPRTIRSF